MDLVYIGFLNLFSSQKSFNCKPRDSETPTEPPNFYDDIIVV